MATEGDVQVEGIVDGDVASKLLTVGESATINGAIMADVVRISGTVNGEITGRVVELAKTANITGDINHHSLAIEAGAFVQGLCWHIDDKRQGIAGALPKPNLVVAGSDGGKKDNDETAPKAETGKAAAG